MGDIATFELTKWLKNYCLNPILLKISAKTDVCIFNSLV